MLLVLKARPSKLCLLMATLSKCSSNTQDASLAKWF